MGKKQELYTAVHDNLGFTVCDNVGCVKQGIIHIIGIGEDKCIVTCVDDDRPYIEAMTELCGYSKDSVRFIQKSSGRVPRGTGFGDRVWRRNSKHNGIEVSFNGKPEDNIRENLKSLGFRWSHTSGVWYIGVKKFGEKVGEYLSGIGIKHVEDV